MVCLSDLFSANRRFLNRNFTCANISLMGCTVAAEAQTAVHWGEPEVSARVEVSQSLSGAYQQRPSALLLPVQLLDLICLCPASSEHRQRREACTCCAVVHPKGVDWRTISLERARYVQINKEGKRDAVSPATMIDCIFMFFFFLICLFGFSTAVTQPEVN